MKTLLLTSAGMELKEEILKILPKPATKIKLAYIITASNPEEDKTYLIRDEKLIKEAGFDVENIDIEGKNENELRELLKDKDIIYVQGGNTFYLLKYVRESGFDKIVEDLIDKGAIYIGVSAGSIIMGPTIETAGWKNLDKNIVGLEDLSALNLVPFNIFVHYEEKYKEIIKAETAKSKYPLRILTDEQAFLVKDEQIFLVGKRKEIRI